MNIGIELSWKLTVRATFAAAILFCGISDTQAQTTKTDEFHVSFNTGTVPDMDSPGYKEYSARRRIASDADCEALKKLLMSENIDVKLKTGFVFDFLEAYDWGAAYADHSSCYGNLKAYLFPDDLARVMLGGKWGYVDTNGAEVIPPQFDSAEAFWEGLAAVRIKELWGFIDRRGSWIVPPQYSWVFNFAQGRAAVQSGGRWGYIDRTGKVLVPLEYESAFYFNEDDKLAVVKRNGKFAYMDRSGKLLTPFRYDHTRPPVCGFASIVVDKKYGYVDNKGREVIPAIYDFGNDFNGERACVRLNGKWGEVDRKGKVHWRLFNIPCVE